MINKIKDLALRYVELVSKREALLTKKEICENAVKKEIKASQVGVIRGIAGQIYLESHLENGYVFIKRLNLNQSGDVNTQQFNVMFKLLKFRENYDSLNMEILNEIKKLDIQSFYDEIESYVQNSDCDAILFDKGIIIPQNGKVIIREVS